MSLVPSSSTMNHLELSFTKYLKLKFHILILRFFFSLSQQNSLFFLVPRYSKLKKKNMGEVHRFLSLASLVKHFGKPENDWYFIYLLYVFHVSFHFLLVMFFSFLRKVVVNFNCFRIQLAFTVMKLYRDFPMTSFCQYLCVTKLFIKVLCGLLLWPPWWGSWQPVPATSCLTCWRGSSTPLGLDLLPSALLPPSAPSVPPSPPTLTTYWWDYISFYLLFILMNAGNERKWIEHIETDERRGFARESSILVLEWVESLGRNSTLKIQYLWTAIHNSTWPIFLLFIYLFIY